MSTTHTVWAAFSSWSVSVEKEGCGGDKICFKWQRPHRQHVLVLIIYETFNFVVLCSIADCIRRGPKPLQPQTQEVTTDIRPLHGPCAHGLLQSHKRSQLQVRQQRGGSRGWHSLTPSTFEPENPDYLTGVSAPFRASAAYTSFPDMVRLEEVCIFRAEKMVWESQVFHCHFTSGDRFFSTLVVKYFQFVSNDVQMLCYCS